MPQCQSRPICELMYVEEGIMPSHQNREKNCVVYQVVGSSMPLVGDHQAEDRQLIADVVITKLNQAMSQNPKRPTTIQPSQVDNHNFYPSDLIHMGMFYNTESYFFPFCYMTNQSRRHFTK